MALRFVRTALLRLACGRVDQRNDILYRPHGGRDLRSANDGPGEKRGYRMKRRELILLLGGAMTAAGVLRAQEKAMPVIGYLVAGTSSPSFAPLRAAFRQGLSETGYVEGQNLAIEYRWAEGHYDPIPALAPDLVDRKVDVIAALGGLALQASKNAPSTIPT